MAAELSVQEVFYVIHPLDDTPEAKRSPEHLGVMLMTPAVRNSLFMLRFYLVSMMVLVFYHVMYLAGLFGK